MEEFERSVVRIITSLIAMVTIMFALSIALEAYKAYLGIVKECQCNK